MNKQGVSKTLGSSKGSVSKQLTQVQERIAKAIDLTAKTETKLKDIKDKESDNQDTSPFNYNAAEKFQQSVNTATDKKDAASIKALKNFKRLRKTVLETASLQVYENEIEKIVSQSATPANDEDEEYPDDNPEPSQQSGFRDSEFGPLDKDPSGLKSIGPNLSTKTRKLFWPKISEIADMGRAHFIENLGDPENPADSFWIKKVIQGQCDNLDFLNALIFVISHTDLLNRIFHPAFERHFKHGIYSFKFFKNNNQSYYVLVDDQIPAIKKEDGEYVPFGARSDNNSEYWISLIEKAYAKLHLTYENICSPNLKLADHFYSLTGLLLEEINIDQNSLDLSLFWELLVNFRKYELPIACIKENNGSEGPIPVEDGHIYIILDVLQEDGRDIVKIADPWANSADLMEDQEVPGVYNLDFNVFLETFTKLLLVKDFPENWKGIKFDCEILSSKGGPSPQSSLWVENPQYVFEVTDKEEGNVILRMHRYIGIQSLQAESLGSTFGFALFSLLSTELKIKTPDFKRILTVTKSTENENYVVANLKLPKGKYSLIPFTVEKGELAYFYCELFFDFRENLINFQFKPVDKILEPSFGNNIAALKPRILKNTLRLSDFEGSILHGVRDNIMLLIPHSTSKIIYKEGVTPKFGLQKTGKQGALSKTLGKTNATTPGKTGNYNKRLFDLKLDGQHEYELTAALLGLESGREVEDEDDQINEEISASIEDIVDFSDYGLTDVGLDALLDPIAQNKTIRVLNLAGNKLTDQIIFDLSEKLEVSHHFELEELDLSNNSLGKQAADTLLEMIRTFKNLLKINVSGNKDIPDTLINKIDFALKKKQASR